MNVLVDLRIQRFCNNGALDYAGIILGTLYYARIHIGYLILQSQLQNITQVSSKVAIR